MIDLFLEGCLVGFFAGLLVMYFTAGGTSTLYYGSSEDFDAWEACLQAKENAWQSFRMTVWAIAIIGTGILFTTL